MVKSMALFPRTIKIPGIFSIFIIAKQKHYFLPRCFKSRLIVMGVSGVSFGNVNLKGISIIRIAFDTKRYTGTKWPLHNFVA